jgi:ABC-2 type transport system permease protein
MSVASSSLISLEGKTLWILRSAPVRARDALLSKINLHLLVSAAPCLLASVLAAVAAADSVVSAAIILVVPTAFACLIAYFGLIFNLLHPKFDWLNEIQPVKQGFPVMITMFGSWGVFLALGLLYGFLLRHVMGPQTFLCIAAALLIAATALLHRWLVTAGVRRWDALEN